jgi:hypothetical protein
MTELATEKEILSAAVQKTALAYQENPSLENLRKWNGAKSAFAKADAQAGADEAGERFKNLEAVCTWIITQGYIVSARTIRNHAERPGFPHRQKDGSYLSPEIEAYADQTWENPSRPKATGGDEEDHRRRLAKEQADKLSLANEITRGNYLLRSDVEQRCATAASFLKKDLSNFGPRICDQLVDVASDYLRNLGMDMDEINLQAVIPDLQEEYDRKLDAWLDRYARATSFKVETE